MIVMVDYRLSYREQGASVWRPYKRRNV